MFDRTFLRNDELDSNTVAVNENLPWQLDALLFALVVANCLAPVFGPDAIANP